MNIGYLTVKCDFQQQNKLKRKQAANATRNKMEPEIVYLLTRRSLWVKQLKIVQLMEAADAFTKYGWWT